MTELSIYAKARSVVFLGTGIADANHPPDEAGAPRVTHRVREIAPRSIFLVPSPAEMRRLIDKGRAAPFEPEPGSKLGQLLPAVLDMASPAEAAERGASIKEVRVWRAVRGPAGYWLPAPGEIGGYGALTDAAFPNARAVRTHWTKNPKSVPLFILHEREGVRAFAWVSGALVEALRH